MPYLRPDGKTQVTFDYDSNGKPVRLVTVLISTQHQDGIDRDTVIRPDLIEQVIRPVVPAQFADDDYDVYINPTGKFVDRWPARRHRPHRPQDHRRHLRRHGSPRWRRVQRQGSVARSTVRLRTRRAGWPSTSSRPVPRSRCEVQVAYAIGMAQPMSILVETFGTNTVDNDKIVAAVREVFDLRPAAIVRDLDLKRPIYRKTAAYGHFGRSLPEFTWEAVSRLDDYKSAVGL